MKITLLGHSGFAAEGDGLCLVFDCFTDERGIVNRLPFGKKPVVFFVSHAHRDHFNRRILDRAGDKGVRYVLDGCIGLKGVESAVALEKGRSAALGGLTVRAFGSTDEGVSFLVEAEGRRLFHAGDLNDWYWEDESTPEELAHDEQWFLDEIAPLASAAPDVAFFPVDARLGRHALRGAMHFARLVKPACIIPMHLSGGTHLPGALREALSAGGIACRVAELVRPGDSITI